MEDRSDLRPWLVRPALLPLLLLLLLLALRSIPEAAGKSKYLTAAE